MTRICRSLLISIALLVCNSAIGDLSKQIEDAAKKATEGDCQTVDNVLVPLAEQGNAEAQANLGWLYEGYEVGLYDKCGDPDLDKALKWYRLGAAQGHHYSKMGAVYLLDNGVGGFQSDRERFEIYKELAIEDNVDDWMDYEHIVGLYYLIGLGTDSNKAEAERWFKTAAGDGSSVDEAHRSSLKIYSESLEYPIGHYFFVGVMHEFGLGTPLDKAEAKIWYEKALTAGYLPAKNRIDSLNPVLNAYNYAVESAADLNKGENKYFGKWCFDEGEPAADGVLVLMGKIIFTKSDGYNATKLIDYQETGGNLLALAEEGMFYDLYFDHPVLTESIEGYKSIKVSECNKERTTPEYIVVESDVIELDYAFYKTAIQCEQQGLPSCLEPFIRSQDVSKNGKISLAELTRTIRHLVVWIGISNGMSFEELVGASAGTQFVSPLLAKMVLLNYDYDNDQHLSVSEVLHDFADLGGTAITKEDIRSRLKLEDRIQELKSFEFGNMGALLKMLQ